MMEKFHLNENEKERVILVAVHEHSEKDGGASLEELRELVKTAGAVTVGVLEQNLESVDSYRTSRDALKSSLKIDPFKKNILKQIREYR